MLAIAAILVATRVPLSLHDELGTDHVGPVLSYPLSILFERSEPSLLVCLCGPRDPHEGGARQSAKICPHPLSTLLMKFNNSDETVYRCDVCGKIMTRVELADRTVR